MQEPCGVYLDANKIHLPSAQLRSLLYTHRALFFKGLKLSAEEFWEFCAKLGTPWDAATYELAKEPDIFTIVPGKDATFYKHNSFYVLSNKISEHADGANEPYTAPLPSRALYFLSHPEEYKGGATFIVNLTEAFKRYPTEIVERYKDCEVLYQSWHNRGTHRNWYKLLQRHPVTGERFFMLNYCREAAPWIIGFREKDGTPIPINHIDLLIDLSTSLSYHEHHWEVGDMMVMDNIGLLHGRTFFSCPQDVKTPRAMWRITIHHDLEHSIVPVESIPDEPNP
jgi:alpha-ketoglutarate-dependent taurine dioxygenase